MTDTEVVGLTIFGEARGEQTEGRIAVASVIRNRLQDGRWGDTYEKVCLAKSQFSCWNKSDSNATLLQSIAAGLADPLVAPKLSEFESDVLRECFWIADGLIANQFRSRVGSATHYVTANLFRVQPPSWAKGRTPNMAVGAHVFFSGIS